MRRMTSIILVILFIVISISGIHMVVMLKPQNLYQNVLSNPGEDKSFEKAAPPFYPKTAHEWAGYFFIGVGLVHIVLNKTAMLSYFKLQKNSMKT